MSLPPLPPSGLASDVLDQLPAPSTTDPRRLETFIDQVAQLAPADVAVPEEAMQLMCFTLADELFAVPVERMREVVRVHALTRVPHAPEHVRGVQNLRGRILPVLEVRTRIGLPQGDVTPASRVLVAEARQRLIGLLVDSVQRVTRVPRSHIAPPPEELRTRMSDYIVGVTHLDGRVVLLLQLDALLLLPPSEVSAQ
ncbi:MAG: chemotaxis protein CheW [Archangium sp.]|nr:chemotaxis protein CheW [Archangium sp.]